MTVKVIEEQLENSDMASDQHGEIGAILIWRLSDFVYPNKLGRVFNAQTSFRINENLPPRMPDAAFVKADRMPALNDEDVPFAPDLAVEVMSRTDDWSDISRRARNYLQAGSQLVWVIDPYEQNVFVFKSGQHVTMLPPDANLEGENILPGFKLKVSELFEQV